MDSDSNESKRILCPIITSWIIFSLNFYIFQIDIDYYHYNTFTYWIEYLAILMSFSISLLVTIGYEKNKYYLYLISTILCSIFGVLVTIFLFYFFKGSWEGMVITLGEWAHFMVLLMYNNKMDISCNEVNLKKKLDDEFPPNPNSDQKEDIVNVII